MSRIAVFAALALAALAAGTQTPAFADDSVTAGSLTVSNLWTRATAPDASTADGYLTVTNDGSDQDLLVGVSSPMAESGELRMIGVNDGVVSRQAINGGIEIPAGAAVTLRPGTFHITFVTLKEPLVEGGTLPVTLTFAKAGDVNAIMRIIAADATDPVVNSPSPGQATPHDDKEGAGGAQ